jgi:hypothetical protein
MRPAFASTGVIARDKILPVQNVEESSEDSFCTATPPLASRSGGVDAPQRTSMPATIPVALYRRGASKAGCGCVAVLLAQPAEGAAATGLPVRE